MSWLGFVGLAFAVVGYLLVFRLTPDPWPYVGAVLVILGPLLVVADFVRSRRLFMLGVIVVALIPLGHTALWLYTVATQST
jgi:hypothetical protein